MKFTADQLRRADTRDDLIEIAEENGIPVEKTLNKLQYEAELKQLQIEMVNFQKWVAREKKRVAVIFEGRDAAGKGGSIKRLIQHMNPRTSRVVALTKPTVVEKGQWYFRRYIKVLPNPGEIVFFDRAGFNRQLFGLWLGFGPGEDLERSLDRVP